MSNKYSDARYPEKINDLIDNEGQISEEGKKAIEESGVAAKDPRLPELTPEDVGKMLSVDEEGNYKLVDAPSGGTRLYQHKIQLQSKYGGAQKLYVTFISLDQTKVTEWSLQGPSGLDYALHTCIRIISYDSGQSSGIQNNLVSLLAYTETGAKRLAIYSTASDTNSPIQCRIETSDFVSSLQDTVTEL